MTNPTTLAGSRPSGVLIMHWGHRGAGPRLTYEMARSWDAVYPGEVHVSYNRSGEYGDEIKALGIPTLPVSTYRRTRAGVIMGLPRLPITGIRLRRFIRQHRIATVINVMPSIYQALAVPPSLPDDVTYIVCLHDAITHPGEEHWLGDLTRSIDIRAADTLVTFSSAVADQLTATVPTARHKVVRTAHPAWMVPDGMAVSPSMLRDDHVPVIGFLGRLLRYKGLDRFLDAMRILKSRGVALRFEVHGDGPDAGLMEEADDLGGEWHVGWIEKHGIESILQGIDIVVLPYVEASQSGVLAHALSLGVPVVATPVGGLIEQVRETGGGLLARDADPESIADAVHALLSDPAAYAAASRRGLQASATTYAWRRVVDDFRAKSTASREPEPDGNEAAG